MATFCGEDVYICNVGDSRAYICRNGILHQITKDHVEKLPPMAVRSGRKPRLSQNIGISPEELTLEPYMARGAARKGDVFLLCSDGLTDMVPDEGIERIVSEEQSPRDCVDRLIQKAIENGGRDNVTVIVVRVEDRGE